MTTLMLMVDRESIEVNVVIDALEAERLLVRRAPPTSEVCPVVDLATGFNCMTGTSVVLAAANTRDFFDCKTWRESELWLETARATRKLAREEVKGAGERGA